MSEYPLLVLPNAEFAERPKGSGRGGGNVKIPSHNRQIQRLGPQFERLRTSSELELRNDPSSIAPERALVFEVAGSIGDFYAAVQKIHGLEFLADEEISFEPDEDFAVFDTRKGKKGQIRDGKNVGGRLYMAMPDVTALGELVSLWKQWEHNGTLDRGFSIWKDIFAHLHKIRPWGPQDRIPDDTIEYWKERIETSLDETVRAEVEFWFHQNTNNRRDAYQNFSSIVSQSGGTIVDHAVIEEIAYESALIDLPISEMQRLIDRQPINLAICDDVIFLRPQSTCSFPVEREPLEPGEEPERQEMGKKEPIAALFDAVPVQKHRLLSGNLIVDDPDGLEGMSIVAERVHGTQMASLILHGDRNLDGSILSRPLYVRPVMYAPGGGKNEQPHNDRLLIDVFYCAVKRMKDGDEEGEATAPSVFLVNISLGDHNRPFSGPMSPWGKLLDYLSEHYGILFLVSAGNVFDPLCLPEFPNWTKFESATPEERETAVLKALFENKAHRTLLSPAEALNIVTVGSWHEDAVENRMTGGVNIDPFTGPNVPNVSSALGLGHRKTIKPEIHLPGGSEPVSFRAAGDKLEIISRRQPGRLYGLKTAIPDSDGSLSLEGLTAGTSAATAMATRAAHRIFDALLDQDGGSQHTDMDSAFYAVVVKSLLVHSAKWGEKGGIIDELYGPHGQGKYVERRDNVSRLLGYGRPTIEDVLECSEHRATMVGYGEVSVESANLYRIPLPPSLERVREPRSVSVTLAWFSPINPKHRTYRCAKLEAGAVTDTKTAFGVERASDQPSDKSTPRGSLFHVRYAGQSAVPFVDDGHLLLRVWCSEQAGSLDQPIRYGLAVTIEAADGIPVYEEIRARLVVPVSVQPST